MHLYIDWQHFTPWSSLAGGAMIGLAAAILLLVNGKIAGISGILGGLFISPRGERLWRVLFLFGLISAPLAYEVLFTHSEQIRVAISAPMLILAGFLVGFGTRYGSGCTSGHGVCGLARRSPRSLVATIVFMIAGFASTYAVIHVFGAST